MHIYIIIYVIFHLIIISGTSKYIYIYIYIQQVMQHLNKEVEGQLLRRPHVRMEN